MTHPTFTVGILGATGAVGQRFVQLLDGHPWFRVTALAASDRSAGRPYHEACQWLLPTDMPDWAGKMVLRSTEPDLPCQLVFSALPGSIAGPAEEAFAAAGYGVCSNASAHRMDQDVPLLIPDVNPEHTDLIPVQQARRGWDRGFIVTNPNCSTTHLVCALKPIYDAFGLAAVNVVTMQAISGAGYPGVPSLDILDNVIPYIGGEEEKLELEPLKLLGKLSGEAIAPAEFVLSAQANRVAVLDGHLEAVSIKLKQPASLDQLKAVLQSYQSEPQRLGLPSAPAPAIIVHSAPDRPQPRLDRMAGNGMATHVGRLRSDPILDYKFLVLGHNTIRGAAGGAILNAELLLAKGYLGG